MNGGREGGVMDKGRMKRWGKPVRRLSVRDLCIDWNTTEEGGCGLLSREKEGSSECAAIFTSPPSPPLPVE